MQIIKEQLTTQKAAAESPAANNDGQQANEEVENESS
jgi:hypothetical protein